MKYEVGDLVKVKKRNAYKNKKGIEHNISEKIGVIKECNYQGFYYKIQLLGFENRGKDFFYLKDKDLIFWNEDCLYSVKGVYFNFKKRTTTIKWLDDTTTTVKALETDVMDKEKGILLCFMKKYHGNKSKYNNTINKCLSIAKYLHKEEEKTEESSLHTEE